MARNSTTMTRGAHANAYELTPDGPALAIFRTKIHDRVLAPLYPAGQPPTAPQLRDALRTIEQHIDARLV